MRNGTCIESSGSGPYINRAVGFRFLRLGLEVEARIQKGSGMKTRAPGSLGSELHALRF